MHDRRGLFFGWRVVAVSFVGLALGMPALFIFTLGVFTKPIEAELGWTRAQVSTVAAVYTYASMLIAPLYGALLDRVGARRLILFSLPLFAASYAALYFVPPKLAAFYGAWLVVTICGAGVSTTTYNKAVAAWFDRRLGLAVGIAVTGQGVGAAILPPIANALIAHLGWRLAYVALAAIALVVTYAFAIPFLYDSPADKGLLPDGADPASAREAPRKVDASGLSLREALRTRTFWLNACAFLLLGAMTASVTTHQVPMLLDGGMAPDRAAAVQAVCGVAIILGRFAVGFLLDRFFAPRVMLATLVGVTAGLAMYTAGVRGNASFLAAALIGFGLGAEFDVLGYLVARYFGRRAYGKIYGAILAPFQAGAGIGAAGLGIVRTSRGTYTAGLAAITIATVVAAVLIGALRAYPRAPDVERS